MMPIQGMKSITNLLIGENISTALFDAKIFKVSTRAMERESAIRTGDVMSAFTMMLGAPRDILDQVKVPDVFRRDVTTQTHRRVEKYKELLSCDIIQQSGSILLPTDYDFESPTDLGLKCVHKTQLIDDQGKIN